MELVDMRDLKSLAYEHKGSSPFGSTKKGIHNGQGFGTCPKT